MGGDPSWQGRGSLGDIIKRSHDGEEYTLEFARKRLELVAVREDAKPHWRRVVERCEKFKRSLTIQTDDTDSVLAASGPPSGSSIVPTSEAAHITNHIDTAPTTDDVEVVPPPDAKPRPTPAHLIDTAHSAGAPVKAEGFSDESLINGLVGALFPVLGGFPYWQSLRDDVRFHCRYDPEEFMRAIKCNSVAELIEACRPARDTQSAFELDDLYTVWGMVTLFAAGRNVQQILELIDVIQERGEERQEIEDRRAPLQIRPDRMLT